MVKALLKKPSLNPDVLGNYHPISLLPMVCKVLEKCGNSILSNVLETHRLLHYTQTGFHPQHGTQTALLAVVEESKKIIDQGGEQLSSSLTLAPHLIRLILTSSLTGMPGCQVEP